MKRNDNVINDKKYYNQFNQDKKNVFANFRKMISIFELCFLFIIGLIFLSQLASVNSFSLSSQNQLNNSTLIKYDKKCHISNAQGNEITDKSTNNSQYKMAIVIDDFGSYDQSGVEELLKCGEILTCAVIPNVDNTENNIKQITNNNHELILHMPMESHVRLPEDWYGPVYIKNNDTPISVNKKISDCLSKFPSIKGFNIHIGSGVSRNKELMKCIYDFANKNNLYFLDSRTIITNGTTDACNETNSIYLGRDVFLEADKNRSYTGVCNRLLEGASIAREKGYSIVIGHVGAEGGINTAKAICDNIKTIKKMGIKIVPLSEIYYDLANNKL